ncbi:MAG: hypothetical protein GWN67_01970 [Phycisphaerae bacterium]|nr:hypothetical protein [Phycisphaerae bacterium]NIP55726.1 hypothetical protein [Phycisphaerae bacterium]NIS49906.1 hypothetical protein [Phycisphaerae bacterium]NIU07589.1 hypothetical protein [Phycisphaerae bacterium]NIU55199.1 hypothetical protein [Phycisphaerae bacterium]
MVRGISTFTNLPTPLKVGLVVVTGGGILAVFRLIFSPSVFWIVLIGLALVALFLAGYWRLLKYLKKRKAAPMERDLLKSSSATPQGISEPANVAKLDDLRKKFEEGTRKFQSAGKSLYSFPWYVIVGEPGSGKTEAIRHCNVGFPPGLQDEFQGTGGTINMNWWFTDHAVILDTAGRLMFEEVETGGSKEWREFLNLMKKYRPRCPINGVLLVIPSDSLIKDTADQIEQKASKIARQFDAIQRTLDVRFPVFVVVTKSDLINGFRDFFDNLQDPQLQHQMLGWSNPAPLDEPYNTDFIDQHLKTIQGRLFRRRLALLHEVMAEEPGMEKMRTADTLYAFPQSLAKIAPRMARYLELIFSVGSKWSCKPLFFRGIYFTSSMREGSALDEDLADTLGVPVDSLPDGRVWERDRAYFLRDLFVKKIFREQGLVTFATNAKSLHRRRKTAVLVSAAVSVILLLFFTFYAAGTFSKSIGEMQEYFGGIAKLIEGGPREAQNQLQVIKKVDEEGYRYIGRNPIPGIPGGVKRSNVSARLADAVQRWEKKGIPWIFKLAAKFAQRITPEKLKDAQGVLYEVGVLQPFIQAARNRMDTRQDGEWVYQNPETEVLRQLIQLKVNKPLNSEGGYSAQTFLDPFFEYVFSHDEGIEDEEDFKQRLKIYNEDKAELHRPLGIIYSGTWPPASLKTDPNTKDPTIEQGVTFFNDYWTDPNRLSERSRDYAQVQTIEGLGKALEDFNDAEQSIFALQNYAAAESAKPYTAEQLKEFVSKWEERFTSLKKARDQADKYGRALEGDAALEDLWARAAATALKEVDINYKFLLNEVNEVQEGQFLDGLREKLHTTYRQIVERMSRGELGRRFRLLDERFYKELQSQGHLYEIRYKMYSQANDLITKMDTVFSLSGTADDIRGIGKAVADARQQIDRLLHLDSAAFNFKKASAVSGFALGLAERRHLYHIVKAGMETAPKSIESLEALVEKEADWDWKDIPKETINTKYDPHIGGAVLDGWKSFGDTLQNYELPEAKALLLIYKDANGVYSDYAARCIDDYWLDRVPEDVIKAKVGRDSQRFANLIVRDVFDELDDFGKSLEKALAQFSAYAPASDEKVKLFRDNLESIRETSKAERIYRTSRTVLTKWRQLSGDMWEKRRALLSLQAGDFREDYAPFSYRFNAGFVDAYWTELTYSLLGQLANQVQSEGNKAFRELKTSYCDKFPIERSSQTNLTRDELIQTMLLLNKVRLMESFDPKTIGGGARTTIDKIDQLLGRLRQIQLLPAEAQWFERIEKVYQSMPKGQQPYYGRITLLGKEEQDRLVRRDEELLLPFFRKFRLVQGAEKSEEVRTISQDNQAVDDLIIRYPGPPVLVEFYEHAGDEEPNTSVEFPEPWACLRMFHQCYDGRKKGYIRLNIESEEGRGGVLYLLIEFFSDNECSRQVDMPTPEQWPSLKQ